MRQLLSALLATLLSFSVGVGALAQPATDYPARVVTLVVPWTAGGMLDVVARAFAQAVQKNSKATVIVEAVPGAGSMIGTTKVANAKPDGYTVLWGSSSGMVILPQVSPNVRYHPVTSFDAVSWVGASPYFMVVQANSPYKSLRDLLADAKANPGKLSFATAGIGSSMHVTAESMLAATQTKMLHVPFKAGADMHAAVIRNDVTWSLDISSGVMPLVKAGKLRIIATTAAQRVPGYPDVPTWQEEAGMAGFESLTWLGLFMPKGTPQEAVDFWNKYTAIALRDPDVVQVMNTGGFTAAPSTPAQLSERVTREFEQWGRVIRAHNIRVE